MEMEQGGVATAGGANVTVALNPCPSNPNPPQAVFIMTAALA
jgi:hypothetical protein